jgi:hypothetical protein
VLDCQRLVKAATVSTAGYDTRSENQREARLEGAQEKLFEASSINGDAG